MLEPCASFNEEGGDGAGNQQSRTRIEGVVSHAVVHVRKVPQIVGDDPEPQHIGPDHVLFFVTRDKDSEPATDRQQVEQTGDTVHVVPGAGDHEDSIDHLTHAHGTDLEVTDAGLGDVNCQDRRRESKRPTIRLQLGNVSDCHEA